MKNKPNTDILFPQNVKKIFLIMKISMLLIMVTVLNAYATSIFSQNVMISVDMQNVTVREVVNEIEKQGGISFLFNDNLAELNRRVSVSFDDTPIKNVLENALSQANMTYVEIKDNFLVLLASPFLVKQQQITVRGNVTDATSGEPLPGVNIIIEGTMTGTITDINGEYSLTLDVPDVVLVYSYIGYLTQRVVVGEQRTLNVALSQDFTELDEVVVVGYGTQRRREVTSSIATVREDDFVRGAIISSPLQLVSGKIAGLAISRASGGDPTASVEIQLRGVSSIRGDTAPLVIIDGIPGGNLNTIVPEDIESIDVLRDGSAAAIYGTRGNAGVIIITTKKGTPGRPAVSYSAYAYTETWNNKPEVLNASEWTRMRTDFQNSDNPILQSKASSIIDYGADIDWFSEITRRNSISSVHNLSITGGTETTSYYASANYRDLQGFMITSTNNTLSGRVSLTHSGLNDRLNVMVNLNNSLQKSNPVNYQAYRHALGRNPTMPVYNEDGTYWEITGWNMYNPKAFVLQTQRDTEDSYLLGNTQVTYEIASGLRIAATGAIQRRNRMYGIHESRYSWDSVQGGYKGMAQRQANQWNDRTFESTLNYFNLFEGIHNFTAMAGYSYQDFLYEHFSARNRGFISDVLSYNNLGAGQAISDGDFRDDIVSDKSSNKLIAFFGRVTYSYDDIYMLSASLRNEGSSRFGADHKWGLFPALSVGWTVSRESFMQNVDFIDDLKLRIGYGITGNQGIGSYISLERLSSVGVMLYDGKWIPGYAPASNPNPNLRWEKKAETNFGIDIAMFNNIVVNIDLYNRSTTDLLYQYAVPVPPNLHNTLWTNVGEINNKGIEFTFIASPIRTSSFSWRTNLNISYNKNMLVSLSDDNYQHAFLELGTLSAPGLNLLHTMRLEEGKPIGNFYTYAYAGFSDDQKWLLWDKDNKEKRTLEEVKYEDRRIVGNGLPKSWVGFSNNFTYNNFDLSVSFRGALFFHILNQHRLYYENRIMAPQNILRSALDQEVVDDLMISDYYIERGDYLKLDNLTISYRVPLRSDVFRLFNVYVSANNLFTITGYKGQDPETNITGLEPGMDMRWIYPSVKTFAIGVNVQF